MRSAILIACNRAGVITTASLMHDESDENENVELTIGDYKYTFSNEGKLQSSSEVQTCSNNNPNISVSCAQFPPIISCVPSDSVNGDKTGQANSNYDVDTEQKNCGKNDVVINEKICPESKGQTFDINTRI